MGMGLGKNWNKTMGMGMIFYTVFRKKHPLMFSIITPVFLVDFNTFCTNGNRNEYSTIYLFNSLMTS